MSSKPYRSRDACEVCHRRKVRCVLEPDSRACQLCTTNGLPCIFAPRSKPGRPRRENSNVSIARPIIPEGQGEHPPLQSQQQLGHAQLNDQQQFQPYPQTYDARDDADAVFFRDVEVDHDGTSIGVFAYPSLWETNFEGGGEMLPAPEDGTKAGMPSTIHGQRNVITRHATQELMPYQPPAPISSAASNPGTEFSNDLGSGSNTFTTTLQLCLELDRHYCSLQQDQKFDENKQLILAAIELTGSTALSIIHSPSQSTSPSDALVLAATLKVLDLCQTMLQLSQTSQTNDANEKANELEHLFFLKRLDIALLQARTFLAHRSHSGAADKALQIHRSLTTTLKSQFEPYMW
ncbi:hypothetical protein ONS95_012512 [Cadophora gregata]|uniref:uncharacterized protein n=1 Tax=Cadophora gregata TaxID=51156 RepID=UPI0026DA8B34|nr:uncharacterized protein ONS95_012512 [Cadophora gregata]KAK0118208.1 hypothetical protein ONS95_012512 [Cadophora gregata]KAK0123281.1 hypothetical protein ONS96_010279 [Cadophora gregata f. sp. sojae]